MTKEERAKADIIKKYIGCDCLVPYGGYTHSDKTPHAEKLVGIIEDDKLMIFTIDTVTIQHSELGMQVQRGLRNCFEDEEALKVKLILKDLQDISDEHAIEVAKMLGYKQGKKTKYNNDAYTLSELKQIGYSCVLGIGINKFVESFEVLLPIIDYLRSQGYNLGDVPQDMYINAKEVSNG